MSDTGAKGRSTADEDEYSESTKTVKRDDCLWAHGSRFGKKCDTWAKDRSRAGSCNHLITLATKSTGNLVFEPPARMVVCSENFLRDGARHHAPCCGKGQQIVVSAIFKAFSKNARIGDRSGYRAFRSRVMSVQ